MLETRASALETGHRSRWTRGSPGQPSVRASALVWPENSLACGIKNSFPTRIKGPVTSPEGCAKADREETSASASASTSTPVDSSGICTVTILLTHNRNEESSSNAYLRCKDPGKIWSRACMVIRLVEARSHRTHLRLQLCASIRRLLNASHDSQAWNDDDDATQALQSRGLGFLSVKFIAAKV